jgi:uncharacterized membrane protein
MFEFSTYNLVLFLHIASATALVGHTLGVPLVIRAIRDARSLDTLRGWLDFARTSARFNLALAMVLLASGLHLGRQAGWLTEGWVIVSVASWVINSILAVRVVERTGKALSVAAGGVGDGPIPPEVEALRGSRGWALGAEVMLASDLAILYLMVAKPSLVESLVVPGALNAIVVVRRALTT